MEAEKESEALTARKGEVGNVLSSKQGTQLEPRLEVENEPMRRKAGENQKRPQVGLHDLWPSVSISRAQCPLSELGPLILNAGHPPSLLRAIMGPAPGKLGPGPAPQLLLGLQLRPGMRCLNPGRDYYLLLGEEVEFLGDQ